MSTWQCHSPVLSSAPTVFQALVNDVLRDMANHFVFMYLDDILIFSKNLQEHITYVRAVLWTLLENKLFVKSKKKRFPGLLYLVSGLYHFSRCHLNGPIENQGSGRLAPSWDTQTVTEISSEATVLWQHPLCTSLTPAKLFFAGIQRQRERSRNWSNRSPLPPFSRFHIDSLSSKLMYQIQTLSKGNERNTWTTRL